MYLYTAPVILSLLSAVLVSTTSNPSPSSIIPIDTPSFAQVNPNGAGLIYHPPGGPTRMAWPGGVIPSWAPKPKLHGHKNLKPEDILKSIHKPASLPSLLDKSTLSESTSPLPQVNAIVSQNREFKHPESEQQKSGDQESEHHHFSHRLSKPAGITSLFGSIEHSSIQQLEALLVVLVFLLAVRLAKRKGWRRVLPRAIRGGLEEHQKRLSVHEVA